MVIVLWHVSDYLPELLAEQPEISLALTLVPAEASGVVVEDGAGGCVGYFSFNGNLDTGITIRTALLKDGKA